MDTSELVARTKAIRLSQRELAGLAAVDQNTVGRSLRPGARGPYLSTVTKIMAAIEAEERRLLRHLIAIHGVPQE